jgi:hypothetical protein
MEDMSSFGSFKIQLPHPHLSTCLIGDDTVKISLAHNWFPQIIPARYKSRFGKKGYFREIPRNRISKKQSPSVSLPVT